MQSLVKPAPQRVLSIDVLRGLTIAFMVLVNDPGDWAHVYPQLDHAPWNGFTATDLVFPNFLFLVGVSIILSLHSRIARGEPRRNLALHMLRRAATLFAIKLFLSAFPHFHVAHLRLYGVLTRIALCYLAAGLICLAAWNTPRRLRTLLAIAAALLVGYWALMRFVPVPGFGIPTRDLPILDPDRNLAAWLDRAVNALTQRFLHTGSLYNRTRDPEGLLSTLPAIATTLLGSITGLFLIAGDLSPVAKLKLFLRYGLLFVLLGLLWDRTFPINKNLWTSSYVLFSAGLSLLLLALCYWLVDIRRLNQSRAGHALLWPWLVFGSNAIFAFCFSNLMVEILLWIKVPAAAASSPAFAGAIINPTAPAAPISAWLWLYLHLFARHQSTELTSLAFALAFVAICFLPNWLLWRRKLFLKI